MRDFKISISHIADSDTSKFSIFQAVFFQSKIFIQSQNIRNIQQMSSPLKAKLPYDYLIKILVLGGSAVGKTCLLTKYAQAKYSNFHIATIGIVHLSFSLYEHSCENRH